MNKQILKFIFLLVIALIAYTWMYHTMRRIGGNVNLNRVIESTGMFIINAAWLIAALEMSLLAGRVFKSEIKWKTHSSLMTLPLPSGAIATQKILGCLMCLVPYFVFFLIGVIIGPHDMLPDFFRDMTRRNSEGLGIMILFILGFVMFLYLNAYYSLLIKWGAFPLALVTVIVGSNCTTGLVAIPMQMFFSTGGRGGQMTFWVFFFVIAAVFVALSVVLHAAIAKQLVRSGAEGQ